MAVAQIGASLRPVNPSHSAKAEALAYAAGWAELPVATTLVAAVVGAHQLSRSLPYEARQHVGYLEGRAVQVGLAHGWGWDLAPHGAGVVSAWEELKTVRADAIEMAMRKAGCGRYSWEANPDLFFELSEAAASVVQAVGEALSTSNDELEKQAA